MSPTDRAADFGGVDLRLREILAPLATRLVATKDGPDGLALEIRGLFAELERLTKAGFERYLALAEDVAREKAQPGVR